MSDDVGPNCLQCMVGSLDRIFDDIILRMGKTNRFCMRLLTPIMVAALIWLRHLVEVIWPSPSRNTFSQHLAVVAYGERRGYFCTSLGGDTGTGPPILTTIQLVNMDNCLFWWWFFIWLFLTMAFIRLVSPMLYWLAPVNYYGGPGDTVTVYVTRFLYGDIRWYTVVYGFM